LQHDSAVRRHIQPSSIVSWAVADRLAKRPFWTWLILVEALVFTAQALAVAGSDAAIVNADRSDEEREDARETHDRIRQSPEQLLAFVDNMIERMLEGNKEQP
jgi:hypothetical protein